MEDTLTIVAEHLQGQLVWTALQFSCVCVSSCLGSISSTDGSVPLAEMAASPQSPWRAVHH
ncbi:Hypothetical predicted protein [Xyrichtys novacula]|uniref:Uncharacterized protein n=1 Tax=Xyrichtys novacula TaxID=13765 RepID=A0AAV1G7J3_XYRNO|nr:Hypothetical predicted protein [Xyrichtys novacula]